MLYTQTGFLAALPYVVKAFVGPAGGVLVDWLIKNKMSVKNTRRCVFTFGCTTASIFILITGYAETPALAVAFLTIGVGITGLNASGYAVNILDIAPQYAGVIMGVTNVFGASPGFISPQIVGIVTPNKTAGEWRIVFWITAIVYIIGIVIFGLLVSGDLQPWAQHEDKKDDEDGKKEEDEEKTAEKQEKQDEEKKEDEKPQESQVEAKQEEPTEEKPAE